MNTTDPIVLPSTLASKGGRWLGAARSWIQRRFMNGDSVTWGSDDLLNGAPVTVRDIEEVAAAEIAALQTVQQDRVILARHGITDGQVIRIP